jgi:FMN phosphatase YigB (HAD superfamily)
MTLTLLLDLDDTLLSNSVQTFLPAYLKALGKHLVAYVAPEKMVQELLAATQVMLTNNSATLSLEHSFDQVFYPAIGHPKTELRPTLDQFYDTIFPTLAPLTARRPEAIHLVEYAAQQGHTLVVATNPIFPRKAILHRLSWAGLSPEQVPYALVTDYEHFHFAKPNPAFFAEILAQLGWPNQPAVVIGNSLEDDLLPATQIGLPVYWVVDPPSPLPAELDKILHPLSACGPLRNIPAWLRQVEGAGLRQDFLTPKAILAVLKSTPAALDTFSQNLTGQQWRERPERNEWSITEIFCHLRDVDREVNIPRLEKVIGESKPFLAGMNTDTWAQERNYQQQDGPAALREFMDARTQLIARLEGIDEADWQRTARHAIFGPTTLKELIGFTTTHDRTHVQQCLAATRAFVSEQEQGKRDQTL